MDPYEVLQISPNASDQEIDRAYYYVCSLYHPDKGGDERTFLQFQQAYKEIKYQRKNGTGEITGCISRSSMSRPSDFNDLRNRSRAELDIQYQFNPDDFRRQTGSGNKFNQESFNDRFIERSKKADPNDYTYGMSEEYERATDRERSQYERERAIITSQAESIKPMFDQRQFDNNTFNHIFTHMKKQHKARKGEVDEYKEPKALGSNGLIECCDLTNPQQSAGTHIEGAADFNAAYDCHDNPDQYEPGFVNKFKGRKDITREQSLPAGEMKKRIAAYNQAPSSFKRNKQRLITDQNSDLIDINTGSAKAAEQLRQRQMRLADTGRMDGVGVDSRVKKNDGIQDNYNRMMMLRQPILPGNDGGLNPVLDRPMPVNRPGIERKDHSQAIHESPMTLMGHNGYSGHINQTQPKEDHLHEYTHGYGYGQQVQDTGFQRPPIHRKKKRREYRNKSDELYDLKKMVKRQEKKIKRLEQQKY